jgi:UDP-N-acetyl-D-glucosamine dehydrogenase
MSQRKAGIIGLGYVGLPLAVAMSKSGYEVVGVDVDSEKIHKLRDGESYLSDISDNEVSELLDSGFEPTTDYDELSDVSYISICVPTPYSKTGQPDVSYVVEATERLNEVISEESVVVLESTVYPSATEELVASTLSDNGWEVGEEVYVSHSPERIDPGNDEYDHTEIPKVVGGVTEDCGDVTEEWYSTIFDEVVRVDSAMEAEMAKILENTFRSINIGMINEMATIANELGIDIWEVIDAASTKPFGFMPFYPGPGLGGHCIPIDPQYLSWKASQQGIETRFINLADQVNREMPDHVTERIVKLLNEEGVPLSESSILVLGVSYKPDVPDTRESPAYDIIEGLREYGAEISYHDPLVSEFSVGRQTYESQELTPELLSEHDCCVIVTNHSDIDIELVVRESPLVFDTRNATGDGKELSNVERL